MATRVEQPLRQPQITRESSVGVPGVYYASIPVRPLTSRMDASSLEKLSLYNTIAAASTWHIQVYLILELLDSKL